MRYVYIALITALVGLVIVFAFQNVGHVTVSLLDMRITLPLYMLVVLVYFLGMMTGGFMLTLVRNWIHGARSERTVAIPRDPR